VGFEAALVLNQRVKEIQDKINTQSDNGRARFEAWQHLSDYLAQYLIL
jgi:hypothetical protein